MASGLSPIENIGNPAPRFSPGDGLHLAGIQFLDTTGDLEVPLLFRIFIDFLVQTIQKLVRQCRARCGWERQSFFEDLRSLSSHVVFYRGNQADSQG